MQREDDIILHQELVEQVIDERVAKALSGGSSALNYFAAYMRGGYASAPMGATAALPGDDWSPTYGTYDCLDADSAQTANTTRNADFDGATIVVGMNTPHAETTLIASDDFGRTWQRLATFPDTSAQAVYFDGETWFIGTGDDGNTHLLYTSTDLETFTAHATDYDGSAGVRQIFGDGTAVLALLNQPALDEPCILRSTDGGTTWTAVSSPLDTFSADDPTRAASGWATADKIVVGGFADGGGSPVSALVISSTDHGETWDQQDHPIAGDVDSAVIWDGAYWWVGLWRSPDAAADSWELAPGQADLRNGADPESTWMATWDGTYLWFALDQLPMMFRTADHGETFQWVTLPEQATEFIANGDVGVCSLVARKEPTRIPARLEWA